MIDRGSLGVNDITVGGGIDVEILIDHGVVTVETEEEEREEVSERKKCIKMDHGLVLCLHSGQTLLRTLMRPSQCLQCV